METSSILPVWGQILIALAGILLGGGGVAALFKYRTDKQRNENDLALGRLAQEATEESAENSNWERLVVALATRTESMEGRIVALETELAAERSRNATLEREKLALERRSNLQDIYIDRLVAVVQPPPPEKPLGLA